MAKEALLILENNLVMANLVNRRYTSEFGSGRQGDSINIRRPTDFSVNDFTDGSSSVTAQNIVELSQTLTLDKFSDVTFKVTSKEMSLSIDEFSNNIMKPAVVAMAQQIDSYILTVARDGSSGSAEVAAAGTVPSTTSHLAAIVQRLNEQKAPMSGRNMVVSPKMQTSLFGIADFVQAHIREDGGVALREASLGRFLGVDWWMDQNVPTHTAGTMRSDSNRAALAANGAADKGATSFKIDGANDSASTIVKGDIVRVTHSASGKTYDYVATAASTNAFNTSGGVALPIDPPLYEATTNDDAVVFVHSATGLEQNIAFVPDSVALVMVPLDEPLGPGTDSSVVSHNGYSMRSTITYDHATKSDQVSIDCVYGAKVIQPEGTCRMATV